MWGTPCGLKSAALCVGRAGLGFSSGGGGAPSWAAPSEAAHSQSGGSRRPALWLEAGTDLFGFIRLLIPENHVQDVPFDLEVS